MRKTATAFVFTVLMSSYAGPSFAFGKPMVVHGAGGSSCGDYVVAYDAYRPFIEGKSGGILEWQAEANYWQFEEWVNGYIYGMETRLYAQPPLRPWDEAGMRLWIYDYCQRHPIDVVANAALAFYKALGGKLS